jgi:RHS repeat-associated protein
VDTDAIGSVRMVTSASGQVMARYDYLPFGILWPGTATTEKRLFAGKERDQETSFDYFGGRYLSSSSGRFTTADPSKNVKASLIEPQRWNAYSYALNNPVRLIDPDGREVPVTIAGKLAGLGLESINTNASESQKNATLATFGGLVIGAVAAPPAAVACFFSFSCQATVLGIAEGLSGAPNPLSVGNRTPILLGETMDERVSPIALKSGFGTFAGATGTTADVIAINLAWLKGQIASGARIFDIGIDTLRPERSQFYAAERQLLDSVGYGRKFLRYEVIQGEVQQLFEWTKK